MRPTDRVTVTMPSEMANELRRLADGGAIKSVSSYVTEAVHHRMSKDRHLAELDARLREHWSDEQIAEGLAWARHTLGTSGEGRSPQGNDPHSGVA